MRRGVPPMKVPRKARSDRQKCSTYIQTSAYVIASVVFLAIAYLNYSPDQASSSAESVEHRRKVDTVGNETIGATLAILKLQELRASQPDSNALDPTLRYEGHHMQCYLLSNC